MESNKVTGVSAVLEHDFCIACGNCNYIAPDIFKIDEGSSNYRIINIGASAEASSVASTSCPFSDAANNEEIIAARDYPNTLSVDNSLGRYNGIYIGWDNDDAKRLKSSSGGLASFYVQRAFELDLIDAAICVAYNEDSVGGLSYNVIRSGSASDVGPTRQSKYMLKDYGSALKLLDPTEERLLFIGVPCHVKAIKLLATSDSLFKPKKLLTGALFCGHQKTFAFSEYVAWNLGVPPNDFKSLTYRVKNRFTKSHNYSYSAHSKTATSSTRRVDEIPWLDWGLGLFKLKACDFCDDVAGETADVVFGDAWLKPFTDDYRGTNIVIFRNTEIESIFLDASKASDITLIESNAAAVFQSQAANFRHRKQGLLSRIMHFQKEGMWYPARRSSLHNNFKIDPVRHALYIKRYNLSAMSHKVFSSAKSRLDLSLFFNELRACVNDYEAEYYKAMSLKSKFILFAKKIIKGVRRV